MIRLEYIPLNSEFDMGMIVVTDSVNNVYVNNDKFSKEVNESLEKYSKCDWGVLTEIDKDMNNDSLRYPEDLCILATYNTCKGRIWVSTNRASNEVDGENITTVYFANEK